MGDIAEAIENGDNPRYALDDHHINEPGERWRKGSGLGLVERPV